MRFPLLAVHRVQQRQRMRKIGRLVADCRMDGLAPERLTDQKLISKKRLQGEAPLALGMKGSSMVEDPKARQQPRVASVVKTDGQTERI